MAEEYVSKDQFVEFMKRMEQGFYHANERHTDLMKMMDERFKMMDERFKVMDERFAQVDRRFDQMSAEMRQMRNWLIGLYGIVVFGFIGSIFITIIKGAVVSQGTP